MLNLQRLLICPIFSLENSHHFIVSSTRLKQKTRRVMGW